MIKVLEQKNDVREALEEVLAYSDNLDGVIILGLKKDSGQALWTSTMSGMQKAFLASFLQAWIVKWFRLEDE